MKGSDALGAGARCRRPGAAAPYSFEDFFAAEHGSLYRRMCFVTGHAQEAEEITQDAFLALWERWDHVSSLEDPTGYLYRTAMNVFRKRYRRAKLAIRRAIAACAGPPTPSRRSTSSRTCWRRSRASHLVSAPPSCSSTWWT